MNLAKAGRTLTRSGKTAVQFKFTSTFEYIDLECVGSWRPENLKVRWQRAHRKAESYNIHWVPVEDRGPNGATGRAMFDPTFSMGLIVTLYRDPKTTSFEEKVYKYYIEHEGASGKKVLASFHCDVAEYAGVPNTNYDLELHCEPLSKKVRKAHIKVTLESEYIKEGTANDEDMQSTYSHATSVSVASSMDYHDSDEDTSPFPMDGTNPTIIDEGSEEHKETKLISVPEEMSPAVSDKAENPTSSPPPSASQPWLPATVKLVNQNMTHVPISELDDKQVIGLYFTARCLPCRNFMPKLIEFYKVLRENSCRFHLIYVSSDYTEKDMFQYMQMQKVPFPAISFTSSVGEDLKQKYGVPQMPHLVIINRYCEQVDEQARKSVELAVTNTTVMQCYQDWLERTQNKTSQKLEEKEKYIRELIGENLVLKDRVDELEAELKEGHTVQSNLQQEKKDLGDQMNLQGWLMKRGIRGPTGHKWRRRFFRTDQGNQLRYYKRTTGQPQGWIDLLKVRRVHKASSTAQDKTNLTFEVVTEGRTYELLAENAPDMEKWMTAIKNLAKFYQHTAKGSQVMASL